MIQKPSFDATIAVLLKAYLNNTLVKGECQACAVGNLIAHASNSVYSWEKNADGNPVIATSPEVPNWLGAICTSDGCDQILYKEEYLNYPEIKNAFDSTGYSFEELAKIEFAFEDNDAGLAGTDEQHQFAGLMGVVDALMLIHGVSLDTAAEAKAQFVHA